jgi:hypothetical protein
VKLFKKHKIEIDIPDTATPVHAWVCAHFDPTTKDMTARFMHAKDMPAEALRAVIAGFRDALDRAERALDGN